MRKILLINVLLGFLFTSCVKEDSITDSIIDFTTPYELNKSSDNHIDKRVKEMYDKYKVAIFFNDTIGKKFNYLDEKGDSVYLYEKLDMNWNFSSYEGGIRYDYVYLDTDEKKNKALDFVDVFLSGMSEKMLPFSILLADTVTVTDRGKSSTPLYKKGYRTLIISQFDDDMNEEVIKKRSSEMITDILLDAIKANSKIVAEFASVSDKRKFYKKSWLGKSTDPNGQDLGVDLSGLREKYKEFEFIPYKPDGQGGYKPRPDLAYTIWPTFYNPIKLFDEGYYEKVVKPYTVRYGGRTEEQFNEIREALINKIGVYGFIGGWKNSPTSHSPDNSSEDLEQYIRTLMRIGEEEFIKRYGKNLLVQEKLGILLEYMKQSLGVKL